MKHRAPVRQHRSSPHLPWPGGSNQRRRPGNHPEQSPSHRGHTRSGGIGRRVVTTLAAVAVTGIGVVAITGQLSTSSARPPVAKGTFQRTAPEGLPTHARVSVAARATSRRRRATGHRTTTAPPRATATPPASRTTTSAARGRRYPLHTGIVATTFWVGELFDASLSDGSQVCSTYDSEWAYHWSGVNNATVPSSAAGCAGSIVGGCDGVPSGNSCATQPRSAANGYFPTKVTPKENPFYLDLPFDDLNDPTAFAERCRVIPWANDPGYAGQCKNSSFSYLKNRWVKITGPNKNVCYGQIEDAGPSHGNLYHDANYVFGTNNAKPVQGQFNNAGADVSPALNGCLGFAELDGDSDHISWRFVDQADVPAGPWTKIVTTMGVTE